jgi:microsomal epoxide hydrolase
LLQELAQYWAEEYDWRAAERAMNAYEHYLVDVSGTRVHFMRKPGVGPDPTPLILSHGWPWTFWHWSKVIDRLADPAAFGGDPADAFRGDRSVIARLRVFDKQLEISASIRPHG